MSIELGLGEKEVTVHVAPSKRIANGVTVEFREVTGPGATLSQRVHITKEETQKLHAELGEILGVKS